MQSKKQEIMLVCIGLEKSKMRKEENQDDGVAGVFVFPATMI